MSTLNIEGGEGHKEERMGAQDKRKVEETHLGSGSGREWREEMVVVEEREVGGPKRAPGGSYIARETIQTPPGKRHWHHWTAKHTEAQQARNRAQIAQKEALSDGRMRVTAPRVVSKYGLCPD